MIKYMNNKFDYRLKMVQLAKEYNVSKSARMCGVSRPTVYKWVKRYAKDSLQGLSDRSCYPHSSPNRIEQKVEDKIIRLRKRWPILSPYRMQQEFGITVNEKTIYKVLHRNGLMPKRRVKKRQKRRDLRAWKEQNFNPLEYWQVDTKDCSDIPYYLERIRKFNFPRYLYQARDVRTGVLFSSYAYEATQTNSRYFINQLMTHLKFCGINLQEVTVQTDNGAEYVSPMSTRDSGVTKLIKSYGSQHKRIPLGAKTWQSEVERANGLIENELLAYEKWNTVKELLAKTTAWEYLCA
jgi:transposase